MLMLITQWANEFFFYYLLLYVTFLFLSMVMGALRLSARHTQARLENQFQHDCFLPVSVLVPAHNEEVTAVDSVRSLLRLDYPLYEIVVVDDGSTDATAVRLIEAFSLQPVRRPIRRTVPCKAHSAVYEGMAAGVPITLVIKENGGKADALNMGINVSQYPYFVSMDADSLLKEDALRRIMGAVLEDDRTVACGGLVRIANGAEVEHGRVKRETLPKNLWLLLQIMEYDRSFLSSRMLFDLFNGSLIISGAFGLFKKETVIAAGGYDTATLGEDMELVVRLHVFCRSNHIPYAIRYATDAVCYSQAPDNFRDLQKQRRRWYLGLFQSLGKHRRVLFNPRYGLLGAVSFCYYFLYELLSPVLQVVGLVFIGLAYWLQIINARFMLVFYLLCLLFGVVISLASFLARVYLAGQRLGVLDVLKALGLCALENFGYRQVLAFISLSAFFGYRKRKLDWGRIERRSFHAGGKSGAEK